MKKEINKQLKITGLIALISYMLVILYSWMYANLTGYTFFMIGEPILIIKYSEWVLGIVGIIAATNYLIEELKA